MHTGAGGDLFNYNHWVRRKIFEHTALLPVAATRVVPYHVPFGSVHAYDDTPRVPRDASFGYIQDYGLNTNDYVGYNSYYPGTRDTVTTPRNWGSSDVASAYLSSPAPTSTLDVNDEAAIVCCFLIFAGVSSDHDNAMTLVEMQQDVRDRVAR